MSLSDRDNKSQRSDKYRRPLTSHRSSTLTGLRLCQSCGNRQETLIATAQKTGEVPQAQFLDRVDNVPVSVQRQTSMIKKARKTVQTPQIQFVDRVVDVPTIAQRQVPSAQTVQKTVVVSHGAANQQGG